MKYYHITPIKNKSSILKNGLKSDNENKIWLFTNLEQAKFIAYNQIFISEYSLFEVSPNGINGKVYNDNVAEFGSEFQFIVKQNIIKPQFVKHLQDFSHNPLDLINENEKIKMSSYGATEEQIIDMMRLSPNRLARYNELNGTSLKPITPEEFNSKYSR